MSKRLKSSLEQPPIEDNKTENNKKMSFNINKYSVLLNKRVLMYSGLVIALIIFFISSIFFYYELSTKDTNGEREDTNNDSILDKEQIASDLITPTPSPEPIYVENPITGILMTEDEYRKISERPVIAVMIQNNTESRPEYGLNDADLVYETLTEGGITRFMGIFWSKESNKIQSIRSARKYFVDLLGEYKNPVYLHIGFSSGDPKISAQTALSKYNVRSIGEYIDKISGLRGYSRDSECEKIKSREHCAYSDTSRLWSISSQQKWKSNWSDFVSWLHYDNANELSTKESKEVSEFLVDFRPYSSTGNYDKNYSVLWKYDYSTNKYVRFNQNGTPYKQSDDKQVWTDVIVYQKIVSRPFGDAKNHQYQEVIGSGSGTVFQDGKAYEVLWDKKDFNTRTMFTYKSDREPLKFKRGRVWVMLVPDKYDYTDKTGKTNSVDSPKN